MAVLEIPVRNDVGAFNQNTELDAAIYGFQFRWNERDQSWYFSLLDESGNRIRSGVKCNVNFELLRPLVDNGRPPGQFLAYDARTNPTPPLLEELGEEVVFTYTESET